ncbi:MAG: monofunctional biosynthetic peptidoglycan transglycosylase [Ignavibacteriaceae bacterium]
MNNIQFPTLEIADFYERFTPVIKRKRVRFIFCYLLFLLYFSLPSFQIPVLEYNSFRFTSLMEQRALENFLLFYPGQSWVDIDNVQPYLLKGIISMEDGSFFRHRGVDWKELNVSLKTNQRRGRSVRGGSTITMQTAKNLYLTTNKNIIRKAKEFIIAFRMEKELPKKAILENYINAVEWGEGIFGIDKAAEVYFGKDPGSLTINESSRLAAVIPSPLRYSPDANSRYVLRRSSIIRSRINDIILYPQNK